MTTRGTRRLDRARGRRAPGLGGPTSQSLTQTDRDMTGTPVVAYR